MVRWLAALAAVFLIVPAAPMAHADEPVEVTQSFTGLENLGQGWAYEGWLIVGGAPVSTGTFTVDDDGVPSATRAAVLEVGDAAGVAAFVLTLEPAPDPDPAPSAWHLLGGDFVDGTAQLSVGHAAALGDDFSGAAGSYILAAPSARDAATYKNGIWWLDPAPPEPSSGPGPSLTLPDLPAGWVYEGWVVGPDGPVSTGRFIAVRGADSDGAGIGAGQWLTPAFPGQDFVLPFPKDLTSGYAAVISVEPEPDNSPAPFTLKPLVDTSIDDVGGGALQAMGINAGSFPAGVAVVTAPEPPAEAPAPAQLPKTGGDLLPLMAAAGLLGILLLAGGALALRRLRA